jgi:DegV family protein with EDD domain
LTEVRIVTDSTADVPLDIAARWRITVVPAYVQIEGRAYQDGIGLSRDRFYERLPGLRSLPTTAAPSIDEFAHAYQSLANQAKELVVLTVSSTLSSIYNVAQLAARKVREPRVHVVDSHLATMGHGWLAIAAAEAAASGASTDEVLRLVEEMKPRVHVRAALDTLEYVRRGGRVSWARAKAAQILHIKPIVSLVAGGVQEQGRTRTMHQAIERLVEFVRGLGPLERLAVLHTATPEVEGLRQRLEDLFSPAELLTIVATTAIGTHVGPRAVGVAAVTAR